MKNKIMKLLMVLVALLAAGYLYLYQVFIPNYIAGMVPTVEKLAEDYLYGTVKVGGLRWSGGLSLYAQNVVVTNSYNEKVVEIPELELVLNPWAAREKLTRGAEAINLNGPIIYLSMGEEGRWNVNQLLKPSDSEENPFYGVLNINDAKLDVTLPEHHWQLPLEGSISGRENPVFKVDLLVDKADRHLSVVADLDLTNPKELQGVGSLALRELIYKDAEQPEAGNAAASSAKAVLIPFTIKGKRVQVAAEVQNIKLQDLELQKLLLDGSYDGETWQLDHLSLWSGEGALAMSGWYKDKDGELQVNGRLSEFPIDPLFSYLKLQGGGLASTNFAVRGNLYDPSFGCVVAVKNGEFLGQKLRSAYGFIGMKDNVLQINKYIAHMDQGYHVVDGTIDLNNQEPILDLKLQTRNVRIEPLVALISPDVQITGNVDNVVTIQGSVSNPAIVGKVQASDGSAFEQLFTGIEGDYSYIDGQLTLKNFVVNEFYGTVHLDGTMDPNHNLNFRYVGNNIDIAHLPYDTNSNKLTGLVDLEGRLLGTVELPLFKGEVRSAKIGINGQSLTELQGEIEADGVSHNILNVSFKQPHEQDDKDYGYFVAKGTLDIPGRFMQGKVHMLNADAHSLLLMCKQDYNIHGRLNGLLDISPKGKGSGIDIDVTASDIFIHKLAYYEGRLKGHLQKGLLKFEDVRLQEKEMEDGSGLLKLTGWVDLLQKTVDMQLSAVGADPAIVTAAMKKPLEISGVADMAISLKGSWQEPVGRGSLMVRNGQVEGVAVDSLIAELSLAEDKLQLETMRAANGPYYLDAYGEIPVDLLRPVADRRNPDAQMNLTLDFDNARLGVLPALTKHFVEWGIGDLKGKLQVAGTLEEPLFYGSVNIKDGSLKVKNVLTPVEKLNLEVEFQGNKLQLEELSAQLGKGSVKLDGTYALRTTAEEEYRLHVVAKDASIVSPLISARINGEGYIAPQKYPDFANRVGNDIPMAIRPLISGRLRLDDVLANIPTVPELGESSTNLGLDCQLELGPKIHFYNSALYDFYLMGGLTIKGSTLFPIIDGNIRVKKGNVNYLRNRFDIYEGKAVWLDIGSFLPNITFKSMTRFNQYRVFLAINGPVDELQLQLSSDPSLDQNTIVRMLTLNRDINGNTDVTSEDAANIMTAGLAMTVLGDAELIMKQTFGLDEFRIYTGPVRADVGVEGSSLRNRNITNEEKNQYNLLLSKYLTDRLLLGYTTNMNNTDSVVFGKLYFGDHFDIYYAKNYKLDEKDQNNWYGVEYRTSF